MNRKPTRSWLLPERPDVVGTLCQQAEVTSRGMQALLVLASGEATAAERLRDCEHRADQVKRQLRRSLAVALTTPVDAEDLYVMSERLDAVLNGAKDGYGNRRSWPSRPTRRWRRWRRSWPRGPAADPGVPAI